MPKRPIRLQTLRKRLKTLRQERGLTQEQLAVLAGLGEKYYQNLEAGRRLNPGIEVINKLAFALGVPSWALLYEPAKLLKEVAEFNSEDKKSGQG